MQTTYEKMIQFCSTEICTKLLLDVPLTQKTWGSQPLWHWELLRKTYYVSTTWELSQRESSHTTKSRKPKQSKTSRANQAKETPKKTKATPPNQTFTKPNTASRLPHDLISDLWSSPSPPTSVGVALQFETGSRNGQTSRRAAFVLQLRPLQKIIS